MFFPKGVNVVAWNSYKVFAQKNVGEEVARYVSWIQMLKDGRSLHRITACAREFQYHLLFRPGLPTTERESCGQYKNESILSKLYIINVAHEV